MSDINHKVESERIMSLLGENVIALEGQTDATMIATAIDALRHATLYAGEQTAELVKQQRIANLIALVALNVAEDVEVRKHPKEWDSTGLVASRARRRRAQQQIVDGLGLS